MYKCPLEKFPDGYVDPVAGEAVVSFDFIKRGSIVLWILTGI